MNIFIVEDELFIRNGLERVINQFERHRVIGTADDGETALEWLEKADTLPDLIITDIYMQYLDGLELVEKVNALYPGIKCALLSGHGEFHLAQRAIQLRVSHYLTKPIDKDELFSVLESIRTEVESEQVVRHDLLKREKQSHSKALYVRDKLLSDLLEGRLVSSEEFHEFRDCFPFELSDRFWGGVVRIVGTDSRHTERDLLLYSTAVKYLFTETVLARHQGFVMLKDSNTLVCALDGESAAEIKESMDGLAYHSEHVLGVKIRTGTSDQTADILHFDSIIREAERNIHQFSEEKVAYPLDMERELFAELKSGNGKAAIAISCEMVQQMMRDNAQVDRIVLAFYKLMTSLEHAYGALEVPFDPPRLRGLSWTQLSERMEEWLHEYITQVTAHKSRYNHDILNQAISYMEEHYGDCTLTLQKLAEVVSVHPNYLTQFFKKQTGFSCMQYLARLRIEKAKKLLDQADLKISEIAERVGYENPLYFGSYFKKWVGKNPRDYKKGADYND